MSTLGLVVVNYVGVTLGAPAAAKIANKAARHGKVVFGSESDDLTARAFPLWREFPADERGWRVAHSEADNGRDGASLAVSTDRVQITSPVIRHPLFSQAQARRADMNVRYCLAADLLIDGWYELRVGAPHFALHSTGLQDDCVRAVGRLGLDLFAGDLNMTRDQAAAAFSWRTVRGVERLHVVARPGIRLRAAQRLNLSPSDHPGVRVGLVIPERPGGA